MGHRLKTLINEKGADWDEYLPAVLLSMRTSRHFTTGYTPFYMERGRKARLPIDIATGESAPGYESHDFYVESLGGNFAAAYCEVRGK